MALFIDTGKSTSSGPPPFEPNIHLLTPPITDEVAIKIKAIRENLKDEELYSLHLPWLTDEQIHRFLIARQLNIKPATDMVMNALKWREGRIPTDGSFDSMDDWSDKWSAKFKKEGETGKTRVPGLDKWGRPILVLDQGVQNTKCVNDQMDFLAWNLEYTIKLMDQTKIDKYCVFIHLGSFSVFNTPPMSTTKETMFMLSTGYPERLGHAICYKPPGIFKTFFESLYAMGLMDVKTYSKVLMITGDVSDGSANDKKLRDIIGDDWKVLTGAEQPIRSPKASPGYDHEAYWGEKVKRLGEVKSPPSRTPLSPVTEGRKSSAPVPITIMPITSPTK